MLDNYCLLIHKIHHFVNKVYFYIKVFPCIYLSFIVRVDVRETHQKPFNERKRQCMLTLCKTLCIHIHIIHLILYIVTFV